MSRFEGKTTKKTEWEKELTNDARWAIIPPYIQGWLKQFISKLLDKHSRERDNKMINNKIDEVIASWGGEEWPTKKLKELKAKLKGATKEVKK